MSCTPLPKAAKPVWAKQLTRLPCLVVNVKFQFVYTLLNHFEKTIDEFTLEMRETSLLPIRIGNGYLLLKESLQFAFSFKNDFVKGLVGETNCVWV